MDNKERDNKIRAEIGRQRELAESTKKGFAEKMKEDLISATEWSLRDSLVAESTLILLNELETMESIMGDFGEAVETVKESIHTRMYTLHKSLRSSIVPTASGVITEAKAFAEAEFLHFLNWLSLYIMLKHSNREEVSA